MLDPNDTINLDLTAQEAGSVAIACAIVLSAGIVPRENMEYIKSFATKTQAAIETQKLTNSDEGVN